MISFGPYQEYLKSDELLWEDRICGRRWGLRALETGKVFDFLDTHKPEFELEDGTGGESS
jgi:hypothetical protein